MGSLALADALHLAPGQAYKVSKSALHMLNKQYALDHKDAGFTFLCVSPGVSINTIQTSSQPPLAHRVLIQQK